MALQDIAAIVTVLTGFYLAIANRTSSHSNAQAQAIESAMKSVELREKDIEFLQKKVFVLERYVHYLVEWIQNLRELNPEIKVDVPMSLSEFEVENSEEENGIN
jgi:hypothetical protein